MDLASDMTKVGRLHGNMSGAMCSNSNGTLWFWTTCWSANKFLMPAHVRRRRRKHTVGRRH